MNVWGYSIISVVIISLLSFIGIFTLGIKINQLNKILLYLVSFAAGALLGDVFFHLMPEITEEIGFTIKVSLYILAGIGVSFIVEKIVRWRHCHVHEAAHQHKVHPFAVMNLFGDSVHNFIDGMIIAAGYLTSVPVGIATTLAVFLHEIPQEIGDFAILLHGGFSKTKALFYNFITALTAVLGAIIVLLLNQKIAGLSVFFNAFAVGGFIYIAGADLIPEMHKEVSARKSLMQFMFLVLGVAVMAVLLLLE
ncbi:MAG TPA: ZIP family metal transporter [Candidatus Nanoarchaeia archaeon]|nr:ZIP family metal transporter [Candidatus Nanoarchaeia archaeon]